MPDDFTCQRETPWQWRGFNGSPCIPVNNMYCAFFFFTVNGGFSQWTEFSECTRSCGTGTRFRTRTCDNPGPRFGGNDCTVIGEDLQTFRCNMNPCPGIEL